jgi:signal transduction histidine kinase
MNRPRKRNPRASTRGRFFEKFATAEKTGGTGLGAYSAKLIAKTLGGTIGFETSEEAGTTIRVTLPVGSMPH